MIWDNIPRLNAHIVRDVFSAELDTIFGRTPRPFPSSRDSALSVGAEGSRFNFELDGAEEPSPPPSSWRTATNDRQMR